MALVVTLAVLPILVLELMGGSGGKSSDTEVATPDVPQPSLVVAVDPSAVTTTVSTEVTVENTSTTAAAVSSTPTTKAPTTTTAAPKVAAKAPTTTTTAAPAPAPAPPGLTPSPSEASFLACVRQRESHGDYTAVDPSGTYMGAYQIYQGGWDAVARSIGRSDLVGVKPNRAAPADQDTIALAMLRQYGKSPWGGAC